MLVYLKGRAWVDRSNWLPLSEQMLAQFIEEIREEEPAHSIRYKLFHDSGHSSLESMNLSKLADFMHDNGILALHDDGEIAFLSMACGWPVLVSNNAQYIVIDEPLVFYDTEYDLMVRVNESTESGFETLEFPVESIEWRLP